MTDMHTHESDLLIRSTKLVITRHTLSFSVILTHTHTQLGADDDAHKH